MESEFGEFYVNGSQVRNRVELCPHPGPCKPREEIYEVHLIVCEKEVLSADGGRQAAMRTFHSWEVVTLQLSEKAATSS